MTDKQKEALLRELCIHLKYKGFRAGIREGNYSAVEQFGASLCMVDENGGIHFHSDRLTETERDLIHGPVRDTVKTVLEYMQLMENAPNMNTGNEIDHYKKLADFNGVVLAGHESNLGVQFVTWSWDHDRKGVHLGHYYARNYEGAKQDFATRSGLIPEQRIFSSEQMTEIYRSIQETLGSDYPITDGRRKLLESAADQIEQSVYDLDMRVSQSNQEELDLAESYGEQCPSMDQQL